MPRKRAVGRAFREKRTPGREELIAELLDDVHYPDVNSRVLSDFPEAARAALVAEAIERHWREREAMREPILRERLQKSPVDKWGEVFCERPDLEKTLTAAQRAEWQTWKGNHGTTDETR